MANKPAPFDQFTQFTNQIANAFPAPFTQADPKTIRLLARPLEQLLQMQSEMLKATEPALTSWMRRQREGLDAAMKALERLTECKDMNEAATIQREWADQQMKRWSTEVQAVTEQAMALSQSGLTAARQAAEITTELASLAEVPKRKAAE
jgi:predicted  nucleic acid-binding Zn-ribbon protein